MKFLEISSTKNSSYGENTIISVSKIKYIRYYSHPDDKPDDKGEKFLKVIILLDCGRNFCIKILPSWMEKIKKFMLNEEKFIHIVDMES